jgi:endonuclease G
MSPRLIPGLQIAALILILIISVEAALWGLWTNNGAVIGLLVSVLVGYGGVLSLAVWGDKEQWPRKALAWVRQTLFETWPRLVPTVVVLVAVAAGLGWLLNEACYVTLVGELKFPGKTKPEPLMVTVHTSPPVSPQVQDGVFHIRLPRAEVEQGVTVTAESKNYKAEQQLKASPERFQVQLATRRTLLVRVANVPPLKGQPLILRAREVTVEGDWVDCPVEDNFAYFEAAPNSVWKFLILTQPPKTLATLFTVKSIPSTFDTDLADKQWVDAISAEDKKVAKEIGKDPLDLVAAPSLNRVPVAWVRALTAGETDVPASLPGHDPRLLGWLPRAARLLVRDGYLVSYNTAFKIPNWTAYTIKGEPGHGNRPLFLADPQLPPAVAATPQDYTGSGYDRGHLVSVPDMYAYGQKATQQAGYMSAVCPQTPTVNQKVWYAIEKWARSAAVKHKQIAVMAGPVFSPPAGGAGAVPITLIGKNQVAVPTHFFRIHVCEIDNKLRVLSFLVPNRAPLEQDITRYLVSVDAIEALTGLEFFRSPPEAERKALKAETPRELWP